jgi:hypothetical protein
VSDVTEFGLCAFHCSYCSYIGQVLQFLFLQLFYFLTIYSKLPLGQYVWGMGCATCTTKNIEKHIFDLLLMW